MSDAATMQAQLEVLRNARATGALEASFKAGGNGGTERKVVYRSDAQLAAAIADLERRISALSRAPIRVTYINSSKGV